MGCAETARGSEAENICRRGQPQYAGGLHPYRGATASQAERNIVEDMDAWEESRVLTQQYPTNLIQVSRTRRKRNDGNIK